MAFRTKTWGKRDGDIRVADNVGRIKKELLVAIGSGSNKETIIKMASALETCSSISTDASLLDLNGRWSLLYSTQTNSGVDKDKTTIDKFLAFLYKVGWHCKKLVTLSKIRIIMKSRFRSESLCIKFFVSPNINSCAGIFPFCSSACR